MKLILGLGITGFSIARFLTQENIPFKIADSRQWGEYSLRFSAEFPTVEIFSGDWKASWLAGIDEIFISPGIAQKDAIVVWAREKNINISNDIELFSSVVQAPVVGITGSNGKSTVTQLLGEMARANGKKTAIGGNIGKPVLDCLADDIELYVVELSSYQLDYTKHLNLLTGVVLNITPDHLDRYESFEHYAASKLSLYQYCQQSVINIDEPLIPKKSSATYFGVDMPKSDQDFGTVTCHGSCYFLKGDDILMNVNDVKLIGEHNVANILAAFALGDQIGLDILAMVECVKTFKGLAHRLEWVAKKQQIDYYNDSKATNVIAAMTAINALIDKYEQIVLIAGGIKKQEDYSALFALIDRHVSNVVLIGQSAQALGSNIHSAKLSYASSIEEAVNTASTLIDSGVILLSPACASFDMFDDFEHRGQVFKEWVCLQSKK